MPLKNIKIQLKNIISSLTITTTNITKTSPKIPFKRINQNNQQNIPPAVTLGQSAPTIRVVKSENLNNDSLWVLGKRKSFFMLCL